MNEFIVWDEEEKVFPNDTYRFVRDTSGHLYVRTKSAMLEHQNVENRYFAFDNIGKTDINGKKIYADCSIVEFEFMKEMSREGSYDYEATKHIGFFEYDKDRLSYGIRLLGVLNDWIKFDIFMLLNFKIIDTIQENKLGLYNKDK